FEVQATFTSNLKQITLLLESPEVGFLMVTTPAQDTAPEARHFIQSLRDHRFHFDGVALNRTLGYLEGVDPVKSDAMKVIAGLQQKEKAVLSDLERAGIPICA